jgi:hypothetical protein
MTEGLLLFAGLLTILNSGLAVIAISEARKATRTNFQISLMLRDRTQ